MKYALSVYQPGGPVSQATWRFDAKDEEHAIGIAATILGRLPWDSAKLATSSGLGLLTVSQGIEPLASHK